MFGEPSKAQLVEQIQELQAALNTKNEQLDGARGHMTALDKENKRLKTVHRLTDVAEATLEQAEESGAVQISAEETARGIVEQRYVQGAEAVIADDIITKHSDAILLEHGPEWRAKTEERLRQQFATDGTYDRVRRDVTTERAKEIADQLREERAAQVRAKLEDPEVQAALVQDARRQLEESDYSATLEQQLQHDAQDAAVEQAKKDIEKELEDKAPGRIQKIKDEWRKGYYGREYREKIEENLELEWRKKAIEEVQEEIDDEELGKLLTARAEREKAKLRDEQFFAEYLKAFTSGGVEVAKLPEQAQLTIYLGEQESFKVPEKNRYGQNTGRNIDSDKPRIAASRVLKLTVLKDGRCMVESDSLASSSSVYERNAAFPSGMIIHVGRAEIDATNGGDKKPVLKESLRQGAELYFDDDKTDPTVMSASLPIGNIEVNGHSALDLAPHRLITTSK